MESFRTTLPLAFMGTYFSDGSRAYFPPKMWETGTIYQDFTVALGTVYQYGGVPFNTDGGITSKKYTTENGSYDIYIGYYPVEEYDVNHSASDVTAISGTYQQPCYIITGLTTVSENTDENKEINFSDINGQKALIPHIRRYAVIFEIVNHGEDPVYNFGTPTDDGTCSNACAAGSSVYPEAGPAHPTNSTFYVAGDRIQLIQNALPSFGAITIPGAGFIGGSGVMPQGSIAGTDLRDFTSGSTGGDVNLANPAYSSATDIFSTPQLQGVCLGTVRGGQGANRMVGYIYNASNNLMTSLDARNYGIVASGGTFTRSGTVYPAALSGWSNFNNVSRLPIGGYVWALYWRKIISFTVEDNYTFYNLVES